MWRRLDVLGRAVGLGSFLSFGGFTVPDKRGRVLCMVVLQRILLAARGAGK
jgi:hypothetical protein